MNSVEMSQTHCYQTADLPLASFLSVLGHEIVEIKSENGRGIFVFRNTDQLRQDILAWSNDRPVLMRARALIEAMKNLKGAVGV